MTTIPSGSQGVRFPEHELIPKGSGTWRTPGSGRESTRRHHCLLLSERLMQILAFRDRQLCVSREMCRGRRSASSIQGVGEGLLSRCLFRVRSMREGAVSRSPRHQGGKMGAAGLDFIPCTSVSLSWACWAHRRKCRPVETWPLSIMGA
jgi:hypothetical protein